MARLKGINLAAAIILPTLLVIIFIILVSTGCTSWQPYARGQVVKVNDTVFKGLTVVDISGKRYNIQSHSYNVLDSVMVFHKGGRKRIEYVIRDKVIY